MAKGTQKAKIERLESELAQAHKVIAEQNEYINKIQVAADESFSNSPYKKQLEDKINMLEMKLKSAQDGKEHAEQIAKARDEHLQNIEKQYQDNAYHNYMESNLYQLDRIQYEKLEAENRKQKEQINDLETENKKLKDQTKRLKTDNDSLINQCSPMWEIEGKVIQDLTKLEDKVKILEKELKLAQDGKEHAEQIAKEKDERLQEALKEKENTKHYKKLGRKAKFNDAEIQTIKMTRLKGKSYREIAKQFDCSVGVVHKIINEQ